MGESEANPGESGAETQAPQPRFPLELGHLWPVSLPGPFALAWQSLAPDTPSSASETQALEGLPASHLSHEPGVLLLQGPSNPGTPRGLWHSPYPLTMSASGPTSPKRPRRGRPKSTQRALGEDPLRRLKLDRRAIRDMLRGDPAPQPQGVPRF